RRIAGKADPAASIRRRGRLRVPAKRPYCCVTECADDLLAGFVLAAPFRCADMRLQLTQVEPFGALALFFGNVGHTRLRWRSAEWSRRAAASATARLRRRRGRDRKAWKRSSPFAPP